MRRPLIGSTGVLPAAALALATTESLKILPENVESLIFLLSYPLSLMFNLSLTSNQSLDKECSLLDLSF